MILRNAVLMLELKKQHVIRQLLDMGITEYQNQSIYDLDYYTLRHVLVIEKVKR
ncbi:hypothetical protein [Bacillus alveayuensis]|uniref:hypothetical protein n=1 Tax=Aeribacillus alveayuensis TaxID=279215 RepID=UPI001364B254|nr:hypothetical protein [Bacillus alveayuensis]